MFQAIVRKARKLSALFLMLAILAPALASIMPTPALSAEQQLLFDIGQNICSQNHQGDSHRQSHDDHMKCCVLCTTQSHYFHAGHTANSFTAPHVVSTKSIRYNFIVAIPRAPPDLRATAPRAPPAPLSI